jgi:hypothetical protein
MAAYSVNKNKVYGQDLEKARRYLIDGKKYAETAKNNYLLNLINTAISKVNDEMNK